MSLHEHDEPLENSFEDIILTDVYSQKLTTGTRIAAIEYLTDGIISIIGYGIYVDEYHLPQRGIQVSRYLLDDNSVLLQDDAIFVLVDNLEPLCKKHNLRIKFSE